jgi:histone H3/H4
MPRPGTIIPKAPVIKIMENAGAKRVSDNGAESLVETLIAYAVQVSERAVKIAEHSGRKTVQAGDIRLAVK